MPYLKQCEIVTDVDKLSVDIQQVIMAHQTIKKWAYIVHDKDDTRSHYHIYLNFGGSSIDTKDVAKWFSLGENFVSKVKGRASDMYKYLTHSNDSQKFKHQYSWSEVIANFNVQEESVKDDIIGHYEKFSYAEQVKYVSSLPPDSRASCVSKLDKLWKLRCKELTLSPDRDMKVIFVTGKSGSGKTYYSRKLFESLEYDYCVSSSSNDVFQDYAGQRGMLLDDMRDNAFKFSDLLKILDNHTKSSVFSRFANKPIDCKMIIITSFVPLRYWYRSMLTEGNAESRKQLFRRINSYVEVKEDEILIYNGLDDNGNPTGESTKYVNDVPKLKSQQLNNFDLSSVFDRFAKRSTTITNSVSKENKQLTLIEDDGSLPF